MKSNQSLDGIKVIDCSQILAGPFCSMLLADHGADVIKIEKPNGGDDVRTWGPPFIGKDSSAFVQLNRNKRSLSLDIKSEEGKIILNKLLNDADVLIENSRVGAMKKLGFGYEDVKKINPKIIFLSTLEVKGNKNELLIEILKKLRSNIYVSGQGAKNFIDVNMFNDRQISVEFNNFIHQEYKQINGDFISNLSIIDIILNCGINQTKNLIKNV